METAWVLPMDDAGATLGVVGGKGANLARMTRAGFPVPGGFFVTTAAYRAFVAANDLQPAIAAAIAGADPGDPAALDAASGAILARFTAGALPGAVATAVAAAYARLGAPPVAVRSSATAEDLADLSFAGQQETYLNIISAPALQDAIVRCWASLWTARAIGYRARNGIAPDDIALAVVVQEMVPSEVSGVLFTANPLTGRRDEVVIDATFGLGEALVSGQVEPDHYVVDAAGQIVKRTLGAKALAIVGQAGGGAHAVATDGAAARQALPDAAIRDLARLGRRVAENYGAPQDIEWAWRGGTLSLLQARAITSLYPLPPGVAADPLRVYFSFASVQGVLDPITPLGQDAIRMMLSALSRIFGFHLTLETLPIMPVAGERLWIDVTPPLRNRLGRRVIRQAGKLIDPGAWQALEPLLDDPRLQLRGKAMRRDTLGHVARGAGPVLARMALNLLRPAARYRQMRRRAEQQLARLEAEGAALTAPAAQADFLRVALDQAPMLLRNWVMPGIGAGLGSWAALQRVARHIPGGPDLARDAIRGLPHNVTTEMDLALWQTAQRIGAAPAAAAFDRESAAALAAAYQAGRLPAPAQAAVTAFLRRYGMRGVAEIDLGRRRWHDDPTPIMQVLQSYLQIDDPAQAPDVRFAQGAAEAQAAIRRLIGAARAMSGGRVRAAVVRRLARGTRTFAGMRESPKWTIIRLFGMARSAALRAGAAFVAEGRLDAAEDVVYLHYRELQALAAGEARDWRALVAERRATYRREQARRQIPRVLLSDGTAYYAGLQAAPGAGATLPGAPVSAGVVEGVAHVVFDPHSTRLAPGEILVCPATDPGWTPLFLAAGGLVMELGGLMTHGSVVAREYGIPAVVGVHDATRLLHTGQRIRVDGSRGEVTILDGAGSSRHGS
jgi:rifampicin phosphotransferase